MSKVCRYEINVSALKCQLLIKVVQHKFSMMKCFYVYNKISIFNVF